MLRVSHQEGPQSISLQKFHHFNNFGGFRLSVRVTCRRTGYDAMCRMNIESHLLQVQFGRRPDRLNMTHVLLFKEPEWHDDSRMVQIPSKVDTAPPNLSLLTYVLTHRLHLSLLARYGKIMDRLLLECTRLSVRALHYELPGVERTGARRHLFVAVLKHEGCKYEHPYEYALKVKSWRARLADCETAFSLFGSRIVSVRALCVIAN